MLNYRKMERMYCSIVPNSIQLPLLQQAGKWIKAGSQSDEAPCFVVGLPRSGTHTIAEIFSPQISSHEPWPFFTVSTLLRWLQGQVDDHSIGGFVKTRHAMIDRKIEASHFLHYLSGELSTRFQNARFILTIREPKSWLYSEVNQNFVINRKSRKTIWRQLEEYRYGHYGLAAESWDSALIEKQLWPARAYLSYWRDHIGLVLNTVPTERLLILDVSQISDNIGLIEDFFSEKVIKDKDHKGGNYSKPVDMEVLPSEQVLDQIIDEECEEVIKALRPRMATLPQWL